MVVVLVEVDVEVEVEVEVWDEVVVEMDEEVDVVDDVEVVDCDAPAVTVLVEVVVVPVVDGDMIVVDGFPVKVVQAAEIVFTTA